MKISVHDRLIVQKLMNKSDLFRMQPGLGTLRVVFVCPIFIRKNLC